MWSLPLEEDNPSAFAQPFLFISFLEPKELNGKSRGWYVDVDGRIGLYLRSAVYTVRGEDEQRIEDATPLLRKIINAFENLGIIVSHIGVYRGSGGPTHILRNGVFFRRMDMDNLVRKVERAVLVEV